MRRRRKSGDGGPRPLSGAAHHVAKLRLARPDPAFSPSGGDHVDVSVKPVDAQLTFDLSVTVLS